MSYRPKNIMERINDIELEDLQFVESELSFYQLVSLSFLLYGEDRSGIEFILQKLIVLSQHPPQGKGFKATDQLVRSDDILKNYTKLNPNTWRLHIVEALAIIRAKRVLRKLGLAWQDVYHHYLPNIAELSVYIHPLLKALYKISERLTPDQAGRLISYINTKYSNCQQLRFYDFSYLEVFFINWLSKRVINIGNRNLEDCDLQILIEYFKFNDMDSIKDILLETINQQVNERPTENVSSLNEGTQPEAKNTFKDSGISMSRYSCAGVNNVVDAELSHDFDAAERYKISRESAGFVLIINQNKFYEEKDPGLQHLLPDIKFKPTRRGTDVDRDKLEELFSSYGYTPLIFNNLTHLEILHHIRETVKRSLLKDSIIICILTHGMEGAVYGCNCIPVAITDIKEILTADTLKGKPKIVLLQACQRYDPKVDTTSSKAIENFSPDAYADMLFGMSAIKGTESLRDPTQGSWFVESIYKFIQKYGKCKHMLDILTFVTNDISKKKTDFDDVMLSETTTTLRKELYLPG